MATGFTQILREEKECEQVLHLVVAVENSAAEGQETQGNTEINSNTPGDVHCRSLDKRTMARTHHCRTVHSGFTVLRGPWAPPIHPSFALSCERNCPYPPVYFQVTNEDTTAPAAQAACPASHSQ